MSLENVAIRFYDMLPASVLDSSIHLTDLNGSHESEQHQLCPSCTSRRRQLQAIPFIYSSFKTDRCGMSHVTPSTEHLLLLWQISCVKWGTTSSQPTPLEASSFLDDVCTEMLRTFAGRDGGLEVSTVASWWTLLADTAEAVGMDVAFGHHKTSSSSALSLLLGLTVDTTDGATRSESLNTLFSSSRWSVALRHGNSIHLPSCTKVSSGVKHDSVSLQFMLDVVGVLGTALRRVPCLYVGFGDLSSLVSSVDQPTRRDAPGDALVDVSVSAILGVAVRRAWMDAGHAHLCTLLHAGATIETLGTRHAEWNRDFIRTFLPSSSDAEWLEAGVTFMMTAAEVFLDTLDESNIRNSNKTHNGTVMFLCAGLLESLSEEWMRRRNPLPQPDASSSSFCLDELDWCMHFFSSTAYQWQQRWSIVSLPMTLLAQQLLFLLARSTSNTDSNSSSTIARCPMNMNSEWSKTMASICAMLLDRAIRRAARMEQHGDEVLLRAVLRSAGARLPAAHRRQFPILVDCRMDEGVFWDNCTERCKERLASKDATTAAFLAEMKYGGIFLESVAAWRTSADVVMGEEVEEEEVMEVAGKDVGKGNEWRGKKGIKYVRERFFDEWFAVMGLGASKNI